MQRRTGMWQMGKRRRKRWWRRKGGDASHSWVSQGNWMKEVGGSYCSSWERAIIWYHQTVMNLYCQEKRDGQRNGKKKKSKISRLKEGKQEFQADDRRRLEESAVRRMQMPASCLSHTDTLHRSEEASNIRAAKTEIGWKTKCTNKKKEKGVRCEGVGYPSACGDITGHQLPSVFSWVGGSSCMFLLCWQGVGLLPQTKHVHKNILWRTDNPSSWLDWNQFH